ncbi:hypothetical protein Golax_022029 [Gossypium laxum]|uniref:RNase H type-1 domain-containing protein n=1 Tax=Gossypium laxum TaxID=34288 RepID=A0A7J9APR8_9ROSI|nr:hypothetical protein [Gossypium laxum]
MDGGFKMVIGLSDIFQVETQALLEGLNQIVRDNNRVADSLAREAQGGMKELFIHVNLLIYMRNLLEDDICRAMKILPAKD